MRILFWNTHRNVDINSYILDIVNQNEIDVLVLAEYMAEINDCLLYTSPSPRD